MSEGLLDAARQVLRERFGYPDFRRGQSDAIRTILSGRDVLVVLPTGGGKSVCYQVPALVLGEMSVVVSPLISLMHDQVDSLQRRGIAATCLDGTLTRAELNDRLERAARGEISILYAAPERLLVGDLARRLRQRGVALLAIDEAHCISEWGHDFRPSYLRIAKVREALGSPATIALTATATPQVRRDIVRLAALRRPRVIVTGFDRPNLSFDVLHVRGDAARRAAMLSLLRRSRGPCVVYAPTRSLVERLTTFLTRLGITAAAYHAGREDASRARAQAAFMEDRVRAIVATNAFGMGVDKSDVRSVIHFAMPGTLESYYQEAGRAGRDGLPSSATLLHARADRRTHEYFIAGTTPPYGVVQAVHRALLQTGTLTADELRQSLGGRGATTLDAALRVLRGAGLMDDPAIGGERAWLRVTATPSRIRSLLGSEESVELGILRALWRSHRDQLAEGTVVSLSQLPPGLSGSGVSSILDALQARQLLVWNPVSQKLRLSDVVTPLAVAVPPGSLERHRRRSLARLNAMERYALTRECRRAELLRYFGEVATARCSGCDNCVRSCRPGC